MNIIFDRSPKTGQRMTATWYAVMTGPQMEFLANTNLQRQGYWTWLPHERIRLRQKTPNRDAYKVVDIEQAYFPRYLFAALRKSNESIYAINETDGVSTVVYQGGEPYPIPNEVMDELMARADVTGFVRQIDKVSRKRFKKGAKVKFKDESPLAGILASVSIDKGSSVRIFLELLGKSREISVDPDLLAAE